jgi:Lon protease-like protein
MKRMFTLSNLPGTIPVFPLMGALVLPRARLPLNIFEPRYLQMIDDALKTEHRLIGMIQTRDVPGDVKDPPLQKIGCAGRITSFTETDDGRYLISIKGISRYRLLDSPKGFKPYLTADVNWADFERDLGSEEQDDTFDRDGFIKLLETYFTANELLTDWGSLKDAPVEMLINSLAMMCPFDPEERQALLESPCLKTRRETIATLMEFALRSLDENDGKIQ